MSLVECILKQRPATLPAAKEGCDVQDFQGPESAVFEYLYRDAGNYKQRGAVRVAGRVEPATITRLRSTLFEGDFLIAEQVGLPPLNRDHWQRWGGSNPDLDHTWHEFGTLRAASGPADAALPPAPWSDLEAMLAAFESASQAGWDMGRALDTAG